MASERRTPDTSWLRERIDAEFVDGARYRYTHRLTVLDGRGRVRNTIRHVGEGTRRPC